MDVIWRSAKRVVWTATRATELLGRVEECDGAFVAHDPVAGTFNTFRTLSEAMAAVEKPAMNRRRGPSPSLGGLYPLVTRM